MNDQFLNPSKEFLIGILKKVETFEFTINMSRILNAEFKDLQIELQNKLELELPEKNHREFVQKLGEENFEMIKEIYIMYKSQSLGMQKKDFLLWMKDYDVLKKLQVKMAEIELIFSKFTKKKNILLVDLIEIFYQLYKHQKLKKKKDFREFFKEFLYPRYKEYKLKLSELNIERISIFSRVQNECGENIILQLLWEFRHNLSHVKNKNY